MAQTLYEADMQQLLKSHLGGLPGAPYALGKIDLLLENAIIEVEPLDQWKEAIAKLHACNTRYPDRRLVVYLFGESDIPLRTIKMTLDSCDIEYWIHTGDASINALKESLRTGKLPPSEDYGDDDDEEPTNAISTATRESEDSSAPKPTETADDVLQQNKAPSEIPVPLIIPLDTKPGLPISVDAVMEAVDRMLIAPSEVQAELAPEYIRAALQKMASISEKFRRTLHEWCQDDVRSSIGAALAIRPVLSDLDKINIIAEEYSRDIRAIADFVSQEVDLTDPNGTVLQADLSQALEAWCRRKKCEFVTSGRARLESLLVNAGVVVEKRDGLRVFKGAKLKSHN